MDFTWDDEKANKNLQKHNIKFAEASTCFDDTNGLVSFDEEHSGDEEDRWILIAMSSKARMLFVVFFEVQDDLIHIISARKAEKHEEREYAEKAP